MIFSENKDLHVNHLTANDFASCLFQYRLEAHLSYDVTSGSEITPCNKIDKPLVVYRFSGNIMMSITTLHT